LDNFFGSSLVQNFLGENIFLLKKIRRFYWRRNHHHFIFLLEDKFGNKEKGFEQEQNF